MMMSVGLGDLDVGLNHTYNTIHKLLAFSD
jgi:hypothetical protein